MEVTSIAEKLLFVTVRIDTVNTKGENGSGTGFIFSHKYKGNDALCIVTNKHVVKNAIKGGITFMKKKDEKPTLGNSFRLEFNDFEKLWKGHADPNVDVTVTPLIPLLDEIKKRYNVDIYFNHISSENIPTDSQIKEIDAIEDITFVGYPNGIWDRKNYTPILRRGTTATHYAVDFENEKKFLIDASVFGGSSGSPVFLYNSGSFTNKGGGLIAGSRLYFLGVVAAVFFRNSVNEIISIPIPTSNKNISVSQEMIDLGIVFKANTVTETIEAHIDKEMLNK
ncbi:MAG: trypsin-like peptidase domain-containing protein [Muricauda sp.]|nr:trypsin-like peptidase domain-containing protein [Allomuricauda sp.]MBA4744538.1 trypsin-like peptidase domain-containing protein [Allomuricauda sp.]